MNSIQLTGRLAQDAVYRELPGSDGKHVTELRLAVNGMGSGGRDAVGYIDVVSYTMTEKAAQVGRNVGFLIAGGAVAYAGLLALIAALIICLAENTSLTWTSSAFLVGAVVAGLGGFLVWKGLEALKHVDLAPRATLETLKEDSQWFHGQTRSIS